MSSLTDLIKKLKVDKEYLTLMYPKYDRFMVRKRNKKLREINAPNDFTKMIQSRICSDLLSEYESHPNCFGFEPNRSIYQNAEKHTGKNVLVNMDIKDFFPNTTDSKVFSFFKSKGWNEEACDILIKWTTLNGSLPQGAPSSPKLTNVINIPLDRTLKALADLFKFDYTRYADDLSFSSMISDREVVDDLISCVDKTVSTVGYELHPDKLKVLRRNRRMEVTGLVVNEKVALPKSTRKWLRAVKHRASKGEEITLDEEELNGWLALEKMVS